MLETFHYLFIHILYSCLEGQEITNAFAILLLIAVVNFKDFLHNYFRAFLYFSTIFVINVNDMISCNNLVDIEINIRIIKKNIIEYMYPAVFLEFRLLFIQIYQRFIGLFREAEKSSFFSGQSTKRGGRGCPLRKKGFFLLLFFLFFLLFVIVLLTTQPKGGGLKALLDCPLKETIVFCGFPWAGSPSRNILPCDVIELNKRLE